MILYAENPNNSTHTHTHTHNCQQNEFSKVPEYKVNTKKSVECLYTNNKQSEKEITKTVLFIIASKKPRLLRI